MSCITTDLQKLEGLSKSSNGQKEALHSLQPAVKISEVSCTRARSLARCVFRSISLSLDLSP